MHKETYYYVFYELFCRNNHAEMKYTSLHGRLQKKKFRGVQIVFKGEKAPRHHELARSARKFLPKLPPRSLEMDVLKPIYRI